MSYVVNLNQGWNAGARSKQVCFGDCLGTFSVPDTSAGVVCGLSGSDNTTDYREIAHALYFTKVNGAPKVFVYELGVQKAAGVAYVTADVFTVRRVAGVVTYWKNATLLYTSLTASSGAVFLDCSLYMAGDSIV